MAFFDLLHWKVWHPRTKTAGSLNSFNNKKKNNFAKIALDGWFDAKSKVESKRRPNNATPNHTSYRISKSILALLLLVFSSCLHMSRTCKSPLWKPIQILCHSKLNYRPNRNFQKRTLRKWLTLLPQHFFNIASAKQNCSGDNITCYGHNCCGSN